MRLSPVLGTLAVAALLAGCGSDGAGGSAPGASSPKVALTVTQAGFAPYALITYNDSNDHPCHALGTLTAKGPRVLGAKADGSLAEGLASRGSCLGPAGNDVSLQVRQARGQRIVGGIARAGVTRVIVAGQRVRPGKGGVFLVLQPEDVGSLGEQVELEYHAGHSKRLPLRRVSS